MLFLKTFRALEIFKKWNKWWKRNVLESTIQQRDKRLREWRGGRERRAVRFWSLISPNEESSIQFDVERRNLITQHQQLFFSSALFSYKLLKIAVICFANPMYFSDISVIRCTKYGSSDLLHRSVLIWSLILNAFVENSELVVGVINPLLLVNFTYFYYFYQFYHFITSIKSQGKSLNTYYKWSRRKCHLLLILSQITAHFHI